MSDAAKSYVKLIYNGTDATDTFKPMLESFIFTDNADGEADSISVTVSNIDEKWFKKKWVPRPEDYIKAYIGVKNWPEEKNTSELYCGKFQIDSFTMSGYPQTVELEGVSVPINTGFNVTMRNKTWENTDTERILKDIAENAGVKLVFDARKRDVKELSQTGTDMDTAVRLCSEYDMAIKIYNDKLVVYDRTEYEKKKPVYEIKKDEVYRDEGYSFITSINTLYDSVRLKYGKDDGDTLEYEFVRPGTKGKRLMNASGKVESVADAELKAKAALRENIRKSETVTLRLRGSTRYRAAEVIKLTGFGSLDGNFFIDQVTHNKGRSRYEVSITAHRCVTDF